MITTSTFDSRPAYGGLSLDERAKSHLVVAEGDGASAVLDAFEDAPPSLARTTLLYAGPDGMAVRLAILGAAEFRRTSGRLDLMNRLDEVFATSKMGARLYVAGTESFIGEVIAKAATYGVVPQSVIAEQRGSLARRVQCVHCKHVDEEVTATPYACGGCGQSLFVRDHFSRRHAAFQGVRVDAEVPGEIPAAEELVQ